MIKPIVVAVAASLTIMGAAIAKTIEVVASFTVIADMVHQVGGDRVHVIGLVGPNGDPHAYEPTPQDAQRLRAADIVFLNGLGFEGWMDRLVAASGYKGPTIVTCEGVRTRHMEEKGKEITDPHAWNSVANGAVYVENIAKALARLDPANAATYEANGRRYAEELRALDDDARVAI